MFIAAQICGILGVIVSIIAVQLKEKKNILIAMILVNVIFLFNFLLLGGYSGSVNCFISIFITALNYYYAKINKPVPKWMVAVYYVVAVGCGLAVSRNLVDLMPVVCVVLYISSIMQKKERNLRLIMLVNLTIWIIYDIQIMAYTAIITEAFVLVSDVVALFRYDLPRKSKQSC